jgi:acetyltransferase-like isoleucine patch superfamily enzyme
MGRGGGRAGGDTCVGPAEIPHPSVFRRTWNLPAASAERSLGTSTLHYGSALHRRINQGFHGKVHLKMGCVVCSDVLVRGDIGSGSVDIGKFVVIGESVLIRPPMRHNPEKNAVDIVPVVIGEHVFIGQNTVSEASRIGSCTVIEANCIIGANVEVNHCVWLKANSVVPRDSKLMPFGVYEGHPARLIGQINPDSGLVEMREVVLDAIRRTGLLSAE